MARIAEARPAAAPSSENQVARHRRILHAAAELGAEKGLDGVQMHEVARDAGVAIGTLYRYFPSKTHLFTAVLAERIGALDETTPPPAAGADRVDAVADLLVGLSRDLMRTPLLATAMMRSAAASHHATVAETEQIAADLDRVILRVLGIEQPTERDLSAVRLLAYGWWGLVTAALDRHLTATRAEADMRLAARLLLAARSR
ncbi:TetR family transcriptional regulator [Pseudonocardia nigra]|uniref:TetR family transcriptional regulator n=1 Tax=Pseudonocardia nigra TaxID=1921578 RepID=UPI001C5FDB12|nr:TetR family transcriptional regulator [Pseudonocardia nigra]